MMCAVVYISLRRRKEAATNIHIWRIANCGSQPKHLLSFQNMSQSQLHCTPSKCCNYFFHHLFSFQPIFFSFFLQAFGVVLLLFSFEINLGFILRNRCVLFKNLTAFGFMCFAHTKQKCVEHCFTRSFPFIVF